MYVLQEKSLFSEREQLLIFMNNAFQISQKQWQLEVSPTLTTTAFQIFTVRDSLPYVYIHSNYFTIHILHVT